MLLLLLLMILAATPLLLVTSNNNSFRFYVDSSRVHWETDPRFLSVAIDSHVVQERWKNFDFNSGRVRAMARALAPAYLRLGGTAADLLIFQEDGPVPVPPTADAARPPPTTTTTTPVVSNCSSSTG